MKKLFTLLSLSLSLSLVKADYWTQKADFGGAARIGAVGFSIGNKGYVGTGSHALFGSILYSDFWEYDPLTNIWTQKADYGGVARFTAVGFSINSKGYLGCGIATPFINCLNDFWEYDPVTNTWTQKANLTGGGRMGAVGFSIGNKGYIGTGYDLTNNFKDFWEYDPLVNTWTQKTDFGGSARYAASGFSDGAKGYLGIGSDNTGTGKNDFWEWNQSTNSWTQKATFGGAARSESSAFFICPYGYIGLGTTQMGAGTVSDFWKYNIANNTWTQAANFGNGLREMAVAFAIGNKGYVGTGFINDNAATIDFWEYTPDSACITGIDEFQVSSFEFQISPNPASQYTVISWQSAENKKTAITITDAQGKKVYESSIRPLASDLRLPTSDLQKGIYFVELTNGKQKAVKKFVKE